MQIQQYLDDTTVIAFGNTVEEINLSPQRDVNVLHSWFDAHKPSLNRSKSKTMLFSRNKLKRESVQVAIGSETLEQVTHFKYLGLELDRHLNFKAHADKICGKVNQWTGLLWRIRPFIFFALAKQLYTSLIEPHLLYLDYIYDGSVLARYASWRPLDALFT